MLLKANIACLPGPTITRLAPLRTRQPRIESSQLALSAVMTRSGYSTPVPCRSNISCLSWRLATSSERMV